MTAGAKLRAVTAAAAELRRLRYLQALGIPAVVSRYDLPGARPTRRLGLRPGSASRPVAAPAADSAAAVRRQLRDGPRDTPRDGGGPAPAASPATTPVPPAAGAAAAVRFSLTAVITGARLWLEDLAGEALAREQVQLMTAIGRALDHPQVDRSPARVAQFDWPLLDNPQLDLGAEEARAALVSFICRQVEDQACRAVVCCGDAARERLQGADLPVPLLQLPGSRELLDAPQRKRELWQTLRG